MTTVQLNPTVFGLTPTEPTQEGPSTASEETGSFDDLLNKSAEPAEAGVAEVVVEEPAVEDARPPDPDTAATFADYVYLAHRPEALSLAAPDTAVHGMPGSGASVSPNVSAAMNMPSAAMPEALPPATAGQAVVGPNSGGLPANAPAVTQLSEASAATRVTSDGQATAGAGNTQAEPSENAVAAHQRTPTPTSSDPSRNLIVSGAVTTAETSEPRGTTSAPENLTSDVPERGLLQDIPQPAVGTAKPAGVSEFAAKSPETTPPTYGGNAHVAPPDSAPAAASAPTSHTNPPATSATVVVTIREVAPMLAKASREQENTRLVLRMDPPELGHVTVIMRRTATGLHVSMIAENALTTGQVAAFREAAAAAAAANNEPLAGFEAQTQAGAGEQSDSQPERQQFTNITLTADAHPADEGTRPAGLDAPAQSVAAVWL